LQLLIDNSVFWGVKQPCNELILFKLLSQAKAKIMEKHTASKRKASAKSKPKANKPKTEDVKTGSLGIGDAYAYAVGELLQDSRTAQGSRQAGWLGVTKQSIEAKDCCDRTELKVKGKK